MESFKDRGASKCIHSDYPNRRTVDVELDVITTTNQVKLSLPNKFFGVS